jgi:hypothetical protein
VDLRPLFSLNNVTNSLDITRNSSLESLDGLQNIGTALTVSISHNKILESLNGLNGMENIYLTFSITSNPALPGKDRKFLYHP